VCVCVLIQFEKASEISQIDIGNEASAFVEVLVGKSSAKEEDYQVTRCPVLLHKTLLNMAIRATCILVFRIDAEKLFIIFLSLSEPAFESQLIMGNGGHSKVGSSLKSAPFNVQFGHKSNT